MPLNALNMIYRKFHIAQIIILEDIDNIIKGALKVFSSVVDNFVLGLPNVLFLLASNYCIV